MPKYRLPSPDICGKSSTVSCRQSSRFLARTEDSFLRQVIDTLTQADMILHLKVTITNELISDVKTGDSLGCRSHALVEFTIQRDMGKKRSIVRTLNFRKANFMLFKELVKRMPWEMVLRDRGAEHNWQAFNDAFHRALEFSVLRYKKSCNEGKTPAWRS